MESRKRSIVKAITWRVIAYLITFVVAYLLTKKTALSLGIGLGDAAIKLFAYYFHERLWEKVGFGRKKSVEEDYTI